MRSRKWLVRFGLVLLLAVVVFAGQGWRAPQPVRAAAETVIKIMPLGDSITAGTDASYTALLFTSYRCLLYQKLVAAGYSFDFVGSVHGQWGNNDRTLLPPPGYCTWPDYDEEGHSGYRIDDILAGADSWPGELQTWAASAHPDLVLVYLGTVDLLQNESVASTVDGISQVIDTLRAANPRVRILVAQISPASKDGVGGSELTTIPQFDDLLPALVAAKTRTQSPILTVDMHSSFSVGAHTLDGVHPNATAEDKQSNRWKTGIDLIMSLDSHYSTFIPTLVK